MCSLLTKLHVRIPHPLVIFYNKIDAMQLCYNLVSHFWIKLVVVDFHFIRDQVQNGVVHVAHMSSKNHLADALTKLLH